MFLRSTSPQDILNSCMHSSVSFLLMNITNSNIAKGVDNKSFWKTVNAQYHVQITNR